MSAIPKPQIIKNIYKKIYNFSIAVFSKVVFAHCSLILYFNPSVSIQAEKTACAYGAGEAAGVGSHVLNIGLSEDIAHVFCGFYGICCKKKNYTYI